MNIQTTSEVPVAPNYRLNFAPKITLLLPDSYIFKTYEIGLEVSNGVHLQSI